VDFEYTPEQIQLRKSVREFAEAEIGPHVMEWDEAQIFPLEVVRKLGELGYMGAIFPEELGGAGMGYIEYSIIIEELSRVDGSVGIILAAHTSLCSNHIYKMGSEDQRRRYLPKLASGEWIGCWSLTEPEAGSDAAGTRTHAVKEGECWVLNGAKTFTTNAHYADVCVAMAVTDRAAAQHGISAFLIEKGTAGYRTGKKENKLGLRASATGEVIPISEFQAIQHKLVNMAMDIDAARLLNYRAAWMLDHGKRVTQESSMAKLFASEAAVRIANEAVQIHGGYGFIKDYPVEKFYRDVKLCTIGEGTSEIQRLVIARQLLKS
jgi:alkylation response protein AidB-like acyl-CoA dehydrogenase